MPSKLEGSCPSQHGPGWQTFTWCQLQILCFESQAARHPENPVGDKIMGYSGLLVKTKWNPLVQESSRRRSRSGTCGIEMQGKFDKNFHLTGGSEITAQQQLPVHPLQNLCQPRATGRHNKKNLLLQCTAVKSNALAELMNRASKIHWKNLSLTLNGRNSETKNDKNNPKVPFFQYVQLLRNISFLLKWSFLAKICCCCQMCYFPKLSIFFKMCFVSKMFGLGHNVRFFQNGFCQNVCFW